MSEEERLPDGRPVWSKPTWMSGFTPECNLCRVEVSGPASRQRRHERSKGHQRRLAELRGEDGEGAAMSEWKPGTYTVRFDTGGAGSVTGIANAAWGIGPVVQEICGQLFEPYDDENRVLTHLPTGFEVARLRSENSLVRLADKLLAVAPDLATSTAPLEELPIEELRAILQVMAPYPGRSLALRRAIRDREKAEKGKP